MTKKERKQAEKQRKKGEKEAKHKKEVEEGKWIESTSADGRITTAYLKQPGSKGTIGLRGQVRKGWKEGGEAIIACVGTAKVAWKKERHIWSFRFLLYFFLLPSSLPSLPQALVDHHISEVLTVFLNTTLSTEWVSYLDHAEELPTSQENTHIIYQFFDMPLPLSDREFLFERKVESDRRRKTVVASYRSVEHASKPQRKNVVRGVSQLQKERRREGGREGREGTDFVFLVHAHHTHLPSLPPPSLPPSLPSPSFSNRKPTTPPGNSGS